MIKLAKAPGVVLRPQKLLPALLLLALVPVYLSMVGGGTATGSAALDVTVYAIAGIACGFLNTTASSGSAVSLPILMALGLDPHVANATNRVPVLIGGLTAVATFQKSGQINWAIAKRVVPPMVAGSLLGAIVAEVLPAKDLGPMITAAVLLAFVMLFTKVKKVIRDAQPAEPAVDRKAVIVMFAVGFWTGFIVLDGATYILLALVLLVRLDLLHANAMKALLLVASTVIAFALFAFEGSVQWDAGIVLGIGSIGGSYAGARFAQRATSREWIFRILAAVILLELIHLGAKYFLEIY